jgi:hypothetical protein
MPSSYGIDPLDARNLAAVPAMQPYTGFPTPTVYSPAAPDAYGAQMAALYKVTGGAVSAENDPRGWTPDQAAQQTENAIAKIAQVNPDLAKELAEQHGMQAPDDGGGFWGTLMGGIGKLMEVTHLDDVMEVISRPAHILPEIIMDWGKDSMWQNMGDALSGNSDVSWDDVLVEKFGMERNIFTAALGLVGDIALDPLTYLPLGRLMSMGREVTSQTAGKAISSGIFKEAEEIVAKRAAGESLAAHTTEAIAKADDVMAYWKLASEQAGETLSASQVGSAAFATSDIATQAAAGARKGLRGQLERLGQGPQVLQHEADELSSKVISGFKGVSDDALPGVTNLAAAESAKRGLQIVTSAADEAVTLAYRGNFSKGVARLVEKTGWSKGYAEGILKDWVKEGTGIMPGALGKAKYLRGKAASTQLGGWRFHLNIPVLGVRIAPMRVLPKLIPQLDMSLGRRFFAGISGEMRLERLAFKGGEEEMAAYKLFVEKGFGAVKDTFPAIAKKMAGPGALSRPGSVFMSASEQVGALTAKFSPHAALIRNGGLGGLRLAQMARQSPALHELALRDMQTVLRANGEDLLNGPQSAALITKAFSGVTDEAARTELSRSLERWSELAGPEYGVGSVDDMLRKMPQGGLTTAELQEMRDLETYFRGLGDDGYEAAQVVRQQAHLTTSVPEREGIASPVDRYGFDHRDEMTPTDAARAAAESPHEYLHDGVYVTDGQPLDGAIDESVLQDVQLPGNVVARGVPVRRARDGIMGPGTGATQRELNVATRRVTKLEGEMADIDAQVGGSLFVGDVGDLEAKRIITRDALDKARAEMHQLEAPSQELVVNAKGILDVDLREGGQAVTEGTAGANLPAEIAAHIHAFKDEAEMTAKSIDEAAEAVMDPELKKLAAELRATGGNVPAGVTASLQAEGHAGIRVLTKGPDGEDVEQLIIFRRADGAIPVARINKNASHDVGTRGSSIRSATVEAQDAVRHGKQAKDLPGGSKMWLDRLVRQTQSEGMTFDQAETFIHQQLALIGKDVPAGKHVLEPDFIKALAGKQDAQARLMVQKQFGKAVRTLERLGLTSSVANGGLVGLEKVRYAIGGSPAVVATMSDDVKAAVERNAMFLDEKMKPLAEQAKQAADRLTDHYDSYNGVLHGLEGTQTYEKLLGARGVPVAEDAGDMLMVARMRGTATDLGDGMFVTMDENGSKVFFKTEPPVEDALGHSPPMSELADQAGDGYTIIMHHTPNGNVESIIAKGVNRSKKGVADQEASGVFGYSLDRAVTVAPGETAIAIRVPTASLKPGTEAGTFTANIDVAKDVVGTYSGADVVGTRAVSASGRVVDVSDSGALGVRQQLLKADWTDAGVLDDETLVAERAAARIKAAGVSGELERKMVQQNHDSIVGVLHQQTDDAARAFGKANMEQTSAINEVERLQTIMHTEAAQVRPALFPASEISRTEAGFEPVGLPGFEDLMMPTFMKQELDRAINGFKGLDGVHAEFRKFNSWWKSHATWMWPSFHIRNMYGAYFNNLLGGVDIKDYVMSGRIRFAAREFESTGKAGKWGDKLLRDGGDGAMLDIMKMNGQFTMMGKNVDELTYGDLADMTSSMGVVSSNGQPLMDARLSASETERGGQVWVEKHAATKPYADFAKGVGTGTENVMRTAAFVRGLKTYGTAPEARTFTMLRHGDYADLTDFEYGVVRDIVPFYKWMRTNTPFQVHQLLESPAKLLAVAKLQNAAYVAAGVDPDDEKYKMPKWMGETFNIPFGKADENGMFDMVSLDLPMSDLHKSATDYFTSALPLFQPLFENYVAKQDLFTGAPITDKRIPLAGIWNMPGIRDILKATQFAEEGGDGQLYTTDVKRNFIAVIPEFTKFQHWLFAEPERTANRFAAFGSSMIAFPLRAADEAAMTSAELDFYYSTVEPEMNHLREMGYPLPTVAQLDQTFGDVNQALALQGIVPRPPVQPTFGLAA